jgi:hypothetical protein
MSELDRDLATIASQQRSVITLENVLAVGGTYQNVSARLRSGRWDHLDDGVYRIAGSGPLDWHGRQLVAVLAAGPGALSSHLAGARILGIDGFGHASRELSIPRGRRYRRPDVRTHESTDLDLAKPLIRAGIPVTGPDRALLDLGRYLSVPRLRSSVESARRKDLVTWSSLIETLLDHARRGRPGVRRLREVILIGAEHDEVTDSDFELLVLGLLREAGLPSPALHHEVYDGRRFVAEVDMAYAPEKVAVECDGAVHRDPETHERDLARQNDLVLLGWSVIRFTWRRVQRKPSVVGHEVGAALRAAHA